VAYFRTSITTRASAELAFEYLADFSNAELWDPSVSSARRLSPGPIEVGARFEVLLGLPTGDARLEYGLEECDRHERLVFVAHTNWLRSYDTIRFEPRSDGCRIQYDADLRLFGAAYALDGPVHLGFQMSGARSVRGLERALALLR
jgi:dehydrogenase/reductase SDR family protein 12